MSNDTSKTRYHAEIKLTLDAREVRINVFADTLVEIYRDLASICQQIPGPFQNGAHREIANAELKAEQLRKDGVLPPKTKAAPKTPVASTPSDDDATPVCTKCGSDEDMELVGFTDRQTGEKKEAWKCQKCKKWYWPPK
jgi:hypothetical protein